MQFLPLPEPMHVRFLCGIGTVLLFCVFARELRADIRLPAPPPPQADTTAAHVWRGGQVTIILRGHHGGGSLTFWIAQHPEHGRLSALQLLGDNRATISYQHDGAESAPSDRFSYFVKTGGARISSPAEVIISVDEPPARIQIPAQIEFEEIMAGERETRQLRITNEGGGVLEGRLTASAPWQPSVPVYLVRAGQTQTVAVIFRPEEGRTYVGQLTLSGSDGPERSVLLKGRARSPIVIEPAQLRIESSRENEPQVGSFSLTNRSDRELRLSFETGANFQALPEVALASGEKKEITVALSPDRIGPSHDQIVVSGEGFRLRLPVEADAPLQKRVTANHPTSGESSPIVVPPSPTAAATAIESTSTQLAAAPPESPAPQLTPVASSLGPVQARRLQGSIWELRWAQPQDSPAKYFIEERLLSLDGAGELQTTWRPLIAPKVMTTDGSVAVQIEGLDPGQLHMVRVVALGADGATRRESSLVALAPRVERSSPRRGWLLVFGSLLGLLIFLRWRGNQTSS